MAAKGLPSINMDFAPINCPLQYRPHVAKQYLRVIVCRSRRVGFLTESCPTYEKQRVVQSQSLI